MTIAEYRKEMGIVPHNKYGNISSKAGQSRKEVRRGDELRHLQMAGKISNLAFQVAYELIPKQKKKDGTHERAVKYIADFVYEENGETVVEDSKSEITRKIPVYIVKRKLMLQKYGIEIKET